LAVLWISEDLDELLAVSDRIAVIFEGRIIDIISREESSVEEMGRLMTGMKDKVLENSI